MIIPRLGKSLAAQLHALTRADFPRNGRRNVRRYRQREVYCRIAACYRLENDLITSRLGKGLVAELHALARADFPRNGRRNIRRYRQREVYCRIAARDGLENDLIISRLGKSLVAELHALTGTYFP